MHKYLFFQSLCWRKKRKAPKLIHWKAHVIPMFTPFFFYPFKNWQRIVLSLHIKASIVINTKIVTWKNSRLFLFEIRLSRPPWKTKQKRKSAFAAHDKEMKWSDSDFAHLLPCKYLCRKESPLPTAISPALVLHLLSDQLMVRTQNFYEPVVVPHQGPLVWNVQRLWWFWCLACQWEEGNEKEPPRSLSVYSLVMVSDCR